MRTIDIDEKWSVTATDPNDGKVDLGTPFITRYKERIVSDLTGFELCMAWRIMELEDEVREWRKKTVYAESQLEASDEGIWR